ncbi:MAG: hypothetical protein ABIN57_08080 [Chitinophagaceae bacterium]
MKKVLFLCVFLMALTNVRAQRVYFIYLQSDGGNSFFVKMGDQVYSSSAAGYLIISSLKDSIYNFSIGKAGRTTLEPRFSVALKGSDKGYLIRENDGRLSLFNLQTMEVLQPVEVGVNENNLGAPRSDAFIQLLAKAADDSTLLYAVVITKEEKKPKTAKVNEEKKMEVTAQVESNKAIAIEEPPINVEQKVATEVATESLKKDTVVAQSIREVVDAKLSTLPAAKKEEVTVSESSNKSGEATKALEEKKESFKVIETPMATPYEKGENQLKYAKSEVIRRSESSTTEGFGLIYIDKTELGIDTIRLLIPNPKTPFRNINEGDKMEEPTVVKKEPVKEVSKTTSIITRKINCAYLASESEFKRLRRTMASRNSDEGMRNEAKRSFKNTCYTTEQIRNLSTLFLTAEGKYSFFDIAFGHAVDSEAFASLGSELKDDYYSKRFNALIGK